MTESQNMTEIPQDDPRHDLIHGGRILEAAGQGDMTRGHLSVRVPGRPDLFYMKPHSVGLDEITLENILTIDLEGEVVAGTARRHSEVYIHSEIFRVRPDVMSIVHVHPTYTTAFALTGRPMRALSQGGATFADHLPVFTDTINLIRSKEQGAGVAKALGQDWAVLMRGHGLTMAGPSIRAAVIMCLSLEEAAKIQMIADAVGVDMPDFPADQVASLRDNLTRPDQFDANWAYLIRKTARMPGFG